jgi:Holliday junction resolvase RusA-like endonuclease
MPDPGKVWREKLWDFGPVTVLGPPLTYGNKRAWIRGGKAIVAEANSGNVRTWQDAIRLGMATGQPPIAGRGVGIEMAVAFYLARPKGHYRASGALKPSAPERPTKPPDCDKVARAVADCGTGIWYADDSQIAILTVTKEWADLAVASFQRTVVAARIIEGEHEQR